MLLYGCGLLEDLRFRFRGRNAFHGGRFQSAIPRVVISNRMAASLFGGERAVGRQIVLDYVTYTVCGVTRDVPNPLMASFFDVCIPYSCNDNLMTPKPDYGENISGDLSMILLARSASGFEAVRAELDQQVRCYNESKVDYNVNFLPGHSQVDSAMGSNAWNKVDWQTFMAESGAFLLFPLADTGAEPDRRGTVVRAETAGRRSACARLSELPVATCCGRSSRRTWC